jgi:myxalamid-type polyketide synthase MxaB
MVSWLPLFHDMGLIGGVFHGMCVGNHTVLFAPELFNQRPRRWLEAVSRYRAYVSGAPNFAFDYCVEKVTPGELESLDLSCWRVAFNGAEVVQPATLRRFARTFAPCGFRAEALTPCYGLAEATLMVSSVDAGHWPCSITVDRKKLQANQAEIVSSQDPNAAELAGCGRARLSGEVKIVEPDSGREALPGNIGEIWVAGPHVTSGYWGHRREAREVFQAHLNGSRYDAYLRTGDLGFIHHGELYIVGRLKDLIIIQGQNYYPADLESTVFGSHPACQPNSGAAFAVESGGAERLVIVQETRRAYRRTDLLEAIRAVRVAVARQHGIRASAVVFIRPNSLPKTSSGKVQRNACRRGFLDGGLRVEAQWRAPVFGTEQTG